MSERTWEERRMADKLIELKQWITEQYPRKLKLDWMNSLYDHLKGDDDALRRAKVEDLL